MYQTRNTKQRMNSGFTLRLAIIFSLVAHFLLLWPGSATHIPDGGDHGVTRLDGRLAVAPLALPALATTPRVVESVERLRRAVPPAPTFRSRPADTSPVAALTTIPSQAAEKPESSVASSDAEGLRSYRLTLARQARKVWIYPPQALAEKWEGTAEVRIDIQPGGRLLDTRLERSSGHVVLDAAALKMIAAAAAVAVLPEDLRGHPLSIVLPVRFSLGE